jgi:hypothetical protein
MIPAGTRYIDIRLRQIAAEQGISVLELRRRTGSAPKLPGPPPGRYKPRVKRAAQQEQAT